MCMCILHVYGCTPIYPNGGTSQALSADGRSISLLAYVGKLREISLGVCSQRKPETRCRAEIQLIFSVNSQARHSATAPTDMALSSVLEICGF